MNEILFLAHRIPYPPDKGDKIRSWHLLKGLASRFRVHLGTFVDDPDDWRHVEQLARVCDRTCVRPLNPRTARLRSVGALLAGDPLTLGYYRDAVLADWVRRVASERPLAGVFMFSSSVAQYVERLRLPPGVPRILDLCDVDSDKWRQYAATRRPPLGWVYAREARRLAQAERRYAAAFDSTLVIAEAEAELLRQLAPESAARIHVLPNGVDTGYFDPGLEFRDPFPPDARPIVFTGAMDYHPNVDAVRWFALDILPAVRARVPAAQFWIVGSKPAPAVQSLGGLAGVTVTGRVPDVRPYLARAGVVVAPLRIARGIQNKVLEGLAMARPLVATPNAVQGITGFGARELAIATDAPGFAGEVVRALQDPVPGGVAAAREFVAHRYAWDAQLEALATLLRRDRPVDSPTHAPAGDAAVAVLGPR